jgi:multiple antibiotic resistance protein
MFENLLQLIVLFFVIFDPLASLVVFIVSTARMNDFEKRKVATLAVMVAGGISLLVLIFGNLLLKAFDTNIPDLRVAGGIILGLLGLKMVWGQSLTDTEGMKADSSLAIASVIGTPLLTGPATITTIMIAMNDFGRLQTGIAALIVLITTAIIFYNAVKIEKALGKTSIRIISTILGLITLAWGVKYIRVGLGI